MTSEKTAKYLFLEKLQFFPFWLFHTHAVLPRFPEARELSNATPAAVQIEQLCFCFVRLQCEHLAHHPHPPSPPPKRWQKMLVRLSTKGTIFLTTARAPVPAIAVPSLTQGACDLYRHHSWAGPHKHIQGVQKIRTRDMVKSFSHLCCNLWISDEFKLPLNMGDYHREIIFCISRYAFYIPGKRNIS